MVHKSSTVSIRVGCSMSTIFTGILSKYKFCFDVYGSAVNMAEYLSGVGEAGAVSYSSEMQDHLTQLVGSVVSKRNLVITESKNRKQTFLVDEEDCRYVTLSPSTSNHTN